MNTISIVMALAATPSKNEKEQIIKDAFISGNREFFIGAKLAYDALVSFGVAKVPEIAEEDLDPENPRTFSFDDFISLTKKLQHRQLTGHAARDALIEAATSCHGPTWNLFYRPVILKDMKIGCGETTINKVLKTLAKTYPDSKNYIIPVFECMLAEDGETETHQKKVKGVKLCDYKLDGTRFLAILDKESGVSMFTRNGQPILTFPHIKSCLEKVLEALPGSVVLDGEVMSPHGFQHLMTLLKKLDRDSSMTRLALFDMLPLVDFRKGICKTPLHERHKNLSLLETSGLLKKSGGAAYVLEKQEVDLDTPEGVAAFNEFNRNAIENGVEGIMIKDPESPYVTKRSSFWLKKKPVIEVSLEIISIEEGKPDGKYVGTMGALVMSGIDDGKHIQTNVGSGFSDELRNEIWKNKEQWIGMIAEVRADKLTLEAGSNVWSLRFPRWKGLRGRVPGEKI